MGKLKEYLIDEAFGGFQDESHGADTSANIFYYRGKKAQVVLLYFELCSRRLRRFSGSMGTVFL